MFRELKTHQIVVDASVAALLFLVTLPWTLAPRSFGSWSIAARYAAMGADVRSAIVVALVLCVALAVRRLSPALALGVAWAGAVLQMGLGLLPLPVDAAVFGVLYATAAYGTRVVFWAGLGSSFVGAAAVSVYVVVPSTGALWSASALVQRLFVPGITMYAAAVLALLLSWTVGALARSAIRGRESRAARERAEAETVAEQERVRIARDMHDVVAHSLAVVIAQADGARYAAASDPAAATAALDTISATARVALSDVRGLLAGLRHTQGDSPQPTLADLEALYARVRAAGIDLSVDVDPAPRGEVGAAVQLAVYRIVQEALTNALRHGDGGPVAVGLAWHADRVELVVRNRVDSPARAGELRGHGLIGMRERAQLVGGRLEAGRDAGDAGGWFVVRATIPLGHAAAPPGAAGGAL
ncbi:MAG: histidine kinase [Microbacterium sp.]|uniref:sensor histidine kinase n=1 Tax=Microbacterium sp. TaxID=51671 RepID=UPI0039E2F536